MIDRLVEVLIGKIFSISFHHTSFEKKKKKGKERMI